MPGIINVLNRAASLDTSPAFSPFTGVRLWYDDEQFFFAGDETGRVLEADNPWATQAMADSVLASVSGFVYQPFTAQSALLDPAAELGDGVNVGGVYGPLADITTQFDSLCASDISAPAEEEIDHEYPYLTKQQREMNRKVTLGADYYGTRITRRNGLEVITTGADGAKKARVVLNSNILAFYNDDGAEALYFDAEAGKYRFQGDVDITGGSMNINNNFVVDENGNVTINGNINFSGGTITWGKNDPADGTGISASQARTIISQELVSSPNIRGANYWSADENTWMNLLDADETTVGIGGGLEVKTGDLTIFSAIRDGSLNAALTAYNNKFLVVNAFGAVPVGDWDFSAATVSGLPGVDTDSITVTPVWG